MLADYNKATFVEFDLVYQVPVGNRYIGDEDNIPKWLKI